MRTFILAVSVLLLGSCGGPSRRAGDTGGDTASAFGGSSSGAALAEATSSPVSGAALKLDVSAPPAMLTDGGGRAAWLAEHYWDNLDWGDGRWVADTSTLEGYFTPWAQLLAQMPESEAAKFSGALFRKGNACPDMQLRLLDMAEYFWYHPNSPFRSEELFIPVLEAIVDAPGIDSLYKLRPQAQLVSALKNRPGMRAADIAYATGRGTAGTLYGLRAEYLLLLFYNPDCHNCARVEEHVVCSETFAFLTASGQLKVLALYPDEDVAAWKAHLSQMPAGWTVGHAPMERGGAAAYDLPAIPALYLLDGNKTVVLKDAPVERIEAWLSDNVIHKTRP